MNEETNLESSQTNWEALEELKDEDIDLSEIPEVTAEQIARSSFRVGGGPVSRRKVRVNIYLDAEIVAYFKAQAGGRGYQTLVNEALKENIRMKGIESLLRQVIREEINPGANTA